MRLFRIGKTLNATLDFNEVVSTVIRETIDVTGAEGGLFALHTPSGAFRCEKCFRGDKPVPLEHEWQPGQGIPQWMLTNQKPYLNNNLAFDHLLDPVLHRRFKTRHVLCVPVLDANDKIIGFFGAHNKKAGAGFTGSDFDKVILIAQIASIAIQNALAYREIRRAKDELRLLSTRLLESQDQERRRIARELHDQTAHSLAGVHMNLRRMAGMNGRLGAEAHAIVDESLQMTDQSIDELRTLSYVLHPPLLDEEGLSAAIDWYAAGFTKRSGIQVKVDVPENLGRFPPDHEMAIFRVIQESLSSIRRHSHAESADDPCSPRDW